MDFLFCLNSAPISQSNLICYPAGITAIIEAKVALLTHIPQRFEIAELRCKQSNDEHHKNCANPTTNN